MVRKISFLALFLLVGAVFFNSCKKEELSSKKEILSFIFEASKNAQLEKNYLGDIHETDISTEVAFAVDIHRLIPTIELSPRATVDPGSGILTDLSVPVSYTVTAEDGTKKTFTVITSTAPAPYIGNWLSGPIDFGLGTMRIKAEISSEGQINMDFLKLLTGERDRNSFKGCFEPISRQDSDIKVDQTHRWVDNNWSSETSSHTIMYHTVSTQSMKLYYCICYPHDDWWFQVSLNKQ